MTSKASTLFATTASFGMLAPWLRCPLEGKNQRRMFLSEHVAFMQRKQGGHHAEPGACWHDNH